MKRQEMPSLKSITLGEGRDKETLDLEYIWRSDYDNIGQAAEELPAVISWLNYHYAEAAERADRSKRLLRQEDARMYFELRNGAFESNGYGDKMTEKGLEKAVLLENTVQKAAAKWEADEKLARLIRGQIEAIQAKLDLIRTSEATRRRIHEPCVREEPSNEQQEDQE